MGCASPVAPPRGVVDYLAVTKRFTHVLLTIPRESTSMQEQFGASLRDALEESPTSYEMSWSSFDSHVVTAFALNDDEDFDDDDLDDDFDDFDDEDEDEDDDFDDEDDFDDDDDDDDDFDDDEDDDDEDDDDLDYDDDDEEDGYLEPDIDEDDPDA